MTQIEPKLTILVICNNKTNWFTIFSDTKEVEINNMEYKLVVDQAHWEDITLTAYSDTGMVVDIVPQKNPLPDTPQNKQRTLKPDFVILRNVIHATKSQNYRNLFFGFLHAGIPSINNLESVWKCDMERPIMYGGLFEIKRRLGAENFPLITQYYYPSHKTMSITPQYPIVVKVAHVHSALGKILLEKHREFEDLASVISINEDYSTAEPYINGEYDLRIQKIGDHVRVMKRTGTGQWKTNRGAAILEDVPVTAQYKMWVEEASKQFGGLDICALDIIHEQNTGKEYILELNGTSIGLSPEHEIEDSNKIKVLAIEKLKQHYSKKSTSSSSSSSSAVTTATTTSKTSTTDWQVEKLNLENDNEDLTRQVKKLTSELQSSNDDNFTLRGTLGRLKKQSNTVAPPKKYYREKLIIIGTCVGFFLHYVLARLIPHNFLF